MDTVEKLNNTIDRLKRKQLGDYKETKKEKTTNSNHKTRQEKINDIPHNQKQKGNYTKMTRNDKITFLENLIKNKDGK